MYLEQYNNSGDSAVMVFHFGGRALPLSVIAMVWSGEQRGFAVRTFFENGRSFIGTQRAFRPQFNLARHDTVPHRDAIANWVSTFEETSSTPKPSGPERPKSVRTTENLMRESEGIVQSPVAVFEIFFGRGRLNFFISHI